MIDFFSFGDYRFDNWSIKEKIHKYINLLEIKNGPGEYYYF